MKQKFLIFLLVIFSFQQSLQCQDSTSVPFYQTIGEDFGRAWKDAIFVGKSIEKLDNSDLTYALGNVIIIGTSIILEKQVRDSAHNPKNAMDFFNSATKMGELTYPAILGGGLYIGGLIAGSYEVRTTGRLMFESLALAGITTNLLKYFLGRERPNPENNNLNFKFFQIKDIYHSMPSGHTTVAFAVASVLADRVDRWWGYVGFYSLASLCGYSRIYMDRHWLSDVVLAAAVGIISGNTVCRAEKHNNWENTFGKFYIFPSYNSLNLCWLF